jgi:hypothetical protein
MARATASVGALGAGWCTENHLTQEISGELHWRIDGLEDQSVVGASHVLLHRGNRMTSSGWLRAALDLRTFGILADDQPQHDEVRANRDAIIA